MRLKVKH